MSMKKLAILSASYKHGSLNNTDMYPTPGSPPTPVHGMNVMLGGAMLSGIILVILLYCYCCHKTNRKSQSDLPSYWRDPGLSLEIYTVETQSCYSSEDFLNADVHRPPTPGPPPAYESVVPPAKTTLAPATALAEKENAAMVSTDESGLPSYERAVQLQAETGTGYV